MPTPSQTEGSLQGLGAGLLLPARGSPFGKAPSPPGVELPAVGAERAAPQPAGTGPGGAPPDSLSPAPAVLSAPSVVETLAVSIPPEVPMPEPRDLTPEDLMALFPSSHAEREAASAAALAAVPLAAQPPAAEPLPDWMRADASVPAEPLVTTSVPVTGPAAPAVAPAETVPAPAAEPVPAVPLAAGAPMSAAPAVEEVKEPASAPTPAEPAPVATASITLVSTAPVETQPAAPAPAAPPPGVRVVAAPPTRSAAPAAAADVQHQPGLRLVSSVAQGGGAEMTLDLTKDGLPAIDFDPGASLPANAALTRMFVPDNRLMTLWHEIDSVEADVTSTKDLSQCVASEMLDRLMRARNLLMNDRAQFEEAARQVAEVKYHLANYRGANFFHKPLVISLYLLAFFGLVVGGVYFGRAQAWDQLQIFNTKLDMLWYTMLVGGIGGFTGAAYSLVSHVARDRDYDPQFALWYYQNPWMGLVLGIFVYIAIYILMNLGTLVMSGQVTSGTLISVLITLFFAWMVGFKHNIAFDLADMAMKKLLPPDQAPASRDTDSTKPPASTK